MFRGVDVLAILADNGGMTTNANHQEPAMNSIAITGIAAAHNVAAVLTGHDTDAELVFNGATARIRSGAEITELRFPDCSTVTISAPRLAYGGTVIDAGVSWSSSSSQPTLTGAVRTAQVLAFAAKVADQLNLWVADGQITVTDTGVVPAEPQPEPRQSGEYIVTLSKRYGQNERTNYVDAMDEDDARSCFKDRPADVQIVSVVATGRRY
jgi:hypothetical protein